MRSAHCHVKTTSHGPISDNPGLSRRWVGSAWLDPRTGRELGFPPLTNTAKLWARVLAAAKIAPTRLHDLRHTTASTGIATGASLALIGGVLGHRSQATTQRYAHLSDDPVRATSEAIAERIAKILEGEQAVVVRLLRK